MRILQRILILGLSTFIFSTVLTVAETQFAFAQAASSASPTAGGKKEPRKQTLTFEDELVEGSTQKPELFYLFQKKNFNYKRLIKLRDNFLPEMKRSTEDVQRGRSNN